MTKKMDIRGIRTYLWVMEWVELAREHYDNLIENDYRYFIREYVGDLKGEKVFRVHFYRSEKEAFVRQTELRITCNECWMQKLNLQSIGMFYGMDSCRFYLDVDIHQSLK